MTRYDSIELVIFALVLLTIIPLLGRYMARIFEGTPPAFARPFNWVEHKIYRLCGIDHIQEMDWKAYAKALIYFNVLGFLVLFFLQLAQGWLPLNPQHFSGVNWPLAFNTAASFVTNTNWQVYEGENTLSYLSQSMGLTVQNFLSAASGCAVMIALIRGIKRNSTALIGNYWVDLTRTIVYLLLPLSLILALLLVGQGVIQNFHPYQEIITWENGKQLLPEGPVASQIAIKHLGTNGGGFFNANSAHPFENPTPFSNFLEILAIICIPAAIPYMYGVLIGVKRQGLILLWVMAGMWIVALCISFYFESQPNPVLGHNPVLEGKETRIGLTDSVLWSVTTTATANGAINNMQDSLSPMAGGVTLFQMMIGELIFGGIGTGLCSILMYILLTVFLAGLMVGRTPEYVGKKIEKREIQLAMIAILTPCALILMGTSLALSIPSALRALENGGPHGLTEMLYGFASTAGGNGSAFEGLHATSHFYNLCFGSIMLIARTAILIPSLAIAGSLAQKRIGISSLGTFKTDTPLFGFLLISVIMVVAALTFFPALALGPIVEQLVMQKGKTF